MSKTPIEKETIFSVRNSLRHRGPDAEGFFLSDNRKVALAHNRLSIIDLSTQANQPMYSQDGRHVIIFNGEIYNFRSIRSQLEKKDATIQFKTNSDTEVILWAFHHWGVDMAKHLEGMFAIVIYDKLLEKLFLFRDRMGKKPLYYFHNYECIVFASELKALLQHRSLIQQKEIDLQAIHEFLHLGYIPEPKTIFRSVRKFPAGFVGEIYSDLSHTFYPYWKPEECIEQKKKFTSLDSATKALTPILENAVEKRLISDVPLGSFLSGGTDSSLVTAVAAGLSPKPLKTFCIGFRESKFDEHVQASRVASCLKTDHHEYILSEDEASSILETYLEHFDEPFADTSAIPTLLVSRMARNEVTVALTGDGGDELFLGYGTYTWAKRLDNPWFELLQPSIAWGMKTFGTSRYKRISHLLEKVPTVQKRSHIFSQEQYFFSDTEIRKLLVNHIAYQSFHYHDPLPYLDEEEKQSLFDLKFYLKDDLLVKVDRASMYSSLECRSPLLDHEIVRFAFALDERLKKKYGVTKYILKEILKRYLPKELIYRTKWGFSIPLSRWLKTEFRYLIDQNLNKETVNAIGLVKWEIVERLKKSFLAGEDYLYNRIWLLIVIHKWLRLHG